MRCRTILGKRGRLSSASDQGTRDNGKSRPKGRSPKMRLGRERRNVPVYCGMEVGLKQRLKDSQSFLVAFNSKGTLNASSSLVTVLISICLIAHGFVTTAFRSTVSTRGSFRAISLMQE
jgi:hypothetical protein